MKDREQSMDRLISRREFLKYAGITAAALAPACAHLQKWDGFNPYSARNPSYPNMRTFYDVSIGYSSAGTPGVEFFCQPFTPMTAAAEGIVVEKGTVPRAFSGDYVIVAHDGGFDTVYGHLLQTKINSGQEVDRGTVIGLAGDMGGFSRAKLMMTMLTRGFYVDPDHYGPRHGHMILWDGKTNHRVNNANQKRKRQADITSEMINFCNRKNLSDVDERKHANGIYWDTVDKFKYTEYLANKHPEYFSAPRQKIEALIKEFYDNQPIMLTLPFPK